MAPPFQGELDEHPDARRLLPFFTVHQGPLLQTAVGFLWLQVHEEFSPPFPFRPVVAGGWFRSLERQVHAHVSCELWILARMIASSLESGRSTDFEAGRSGCALFSSQKLHQTLQLTLPLQ